MRLSCIWFIILFSVSFAQDIEFEEAFELPEGFVYVDEYLEKFQCDLGYFSQNNFVGAIIDGYHVNRCILGYKATMALKKANQEFHKYGFGIKIYDAYRPTRSVEHFKRWATNPSDTIMKPIFYPKLQKPSLFSLGYISPHSSHSRGSTVDVTLFYITGRKAGTELDMGGYWDFFGSKSRFNSHHLTKQQRKHRAFLRRIMIKYGFRALSGEWWHFTLVEEQFSEYFDFPVQ